MKAQKAPKYQLVAGFGFSRFQYQNDKAEALSPRQF